MYIMYAFSFGSSSSVKLTSCLVLVLQLQLQCQSQGYMISTCRSQNQIDHAYMYVYCIDVDRGYPQVQELSFHFHCCKIASCIIIYHHQTIITFRSFPGGPKERSWAPRGAKSALEQQKLKKHLKFLVFVVDSLRFPGHSRKSWSAASARRARQ